MRPVGLRDPFRLSHYASPDYQALWPTAPDYLTVLKDGAASRATPTSRSSRPSSTRTRCRAQWSSAIGGKDPKEALDDLAAEWDQLTEQVGVDKQRAAYEVWAAKPSAYRQ